MTAQPEYRPLADRTRARDLDREAALVSLREALVDGQLAPEELDARSARVLARRASSDRSLAARPLLRR